MYVKHGILPVLKSSYQSFMARHLHCHLALPSPIAISCCHDMPSHISPLSFDHHLCPLPSRVDVSRVAILHCHLTLPSFIAFSRCRLALPSCVAVSRCHLTLPSRVAVSRCRLTLPSRIAVLCCRLMLPSHAFTHQFWPSPSLADVV